MFFPFGFNPSNQEGEKQNGDEHKNDQKNEVVQQQFQQNFQISNSFFPNLNYEIPQFINQTQQNPQISQNISNVSFQIPQQLPPITNFQQQIQPNLTFINPNFQETTINYNQAPLFQPNIYNIPQPNQFQIPLKQDNQMTFDQQQFPFDNQLNISKTVDDNSKFITINQEQPNKQDFSIIHPNEKTQTQQNIPKLIEKHEKIPTVKIMTQNVDKPQENTKNSIQTQIKSSEEDKPFKFIARKKQKTDIFIPEFREINEKENPLLWDDIQPGATDLATVFILDAHQQLEEIEDMVKLGYEKNVNSPGSLLRRFNEHPIYGIDRGEAKKLAHYEEKREKTYVLPSWPKRVYDSESTFPMSKTQLKEFQNSLEDWKAEVQDRIESSKGHHRDVSTTTKRRRKARKMSEMITESTDDDTDTDDFYFFHGR